MNFRAQMELLYTSDRIITVFVLEYHEWDSDSSIAAFCKPHHHCETLTPTHEVCVLYLYVTTKPERASVIDNDNEMSLVSILNIILIHFF